MTAAARLLPPMPPPRARRRWTGVALVSLLLHALALLALWTWPQRQPEGEAGAAPSFELMFAPPGAPAVGPESQGPVAPAPAPQPDDALPGPPSPAPEAPPDAAAPPSPTQAPEVPQGATAPPPAVTQAEPGRAAPSVVPDAIPAAPPAPALPAPPPPLPPALPDAEEPQPTAPAAPPSVRLEVPPPPPGATLRQLPDVPLPSPPAPLPPVAPPAPRPATPAPRPRTATPAAPPGSFGNPMDLSFAPGPTRLAAPRLGARPGSVASRSLDLSTGPGKAPNRQEAFFDARAARIGEGWKDGLMAYWLRHRYYPRQALEAGDDGQVEVELTVNRQGKVEDVTIQAKSGSPWLDMAALATWRGAQLRPLPAEVAGDRITFSITINYILLR